MSLYAEFLIIKSKEILHSFQKKYTNPQDFYAPPHTYINDRKIYRKNSKDIENFNDSVNPIKLFRKF